MMARIQKTKALPRAAHLKAFFFSVCGVKNVNLSIISTYFNSPFHLHESLECGAWRYFLFYCLLHE